MLPRSPACEMQMDYFHVSSLINLSSPSRFLLERRTESKRWVRRRTQSKENEERQNARKKVSKEKRKQRTGAPYGQTIWSYPAENFHGSQLWTCTEGPLLLLSRLAKVPRVSRSAICQTRLKICAVGSPVIIAQAYTYRWRGKRIKMWEEG